MHSTLLVLVLSIWSAMGVRSAEQTAIADAIATAVEHEASPASGESMAVDAALLAVYAAHESHCSTRPSAWSWDAKAGLSAGVWQMRSYLVTGRSLDAQAFMWLDALRRGGLAQGIDSDPARAAHRLAEARRLLADALTTSPPTPSAGP